ncbi:MULTISPECIES: caspase family protein [unclassified Streptomyces]|uniref:wHTH domain-containing protein n=1 Tax=unclassified Streptomyces TaxID=2593676 RepID=UPI00148A0871|nr:MULTISPECIES: caspase family protein [unclassified Streptomyces]
MHRALLLFVDRYESAAWMDLEFLRREYQEITTALSDRGYEIDQNSDCGQLRAAAINQKIESFIHNSRRGDNLLVYLSGHGYHYDDAHWFAAFDSDPTTGAQTMSVTNVRLDGGWPNVVELSKAAQVLFIVDACRNRLMDATGPRKLAVTPPDGSERLSYLMACEPEKPAVYLASQARQEETFSLFTQALQEVLSDAHGYLPADHLRALMETAMNDLRMQHCSSTPPQIPRLSGEEGAARFPFLLESQSCTTQTQAVNHHAWKLTRASYDTRRFQHEVKHVASTLDKNFHEERKLLATDSWIDWQSHYRSSAHVEKLLQWLPAGFTLTATEAAILSLVQHLYHGFRVRLARRVDQALRRSTTVLSGAHGAWTQYPHLQRLTDVRLDPKRGNRNRHVAEAWVLHQFLARPGDAHKYEDELLNYLDSALAGTDDLAEVLSVDAVSWLFRAMFHGGSTLAESPEFQRLSEHPIRYQLIGYLLAASQIMALDICELPPVLVEHLGGTDRISFHQIRSSVNGASWKLVGRTLRLEAHCSHQAVMVALQERAESLDGLLYMASGVAGLEKLPNRSSGDGVGPEEDPATGKLKFLPVATRFGLDGTRVRDLLAGEQLYADRSLAVREIYQNAMDACNVRRARELYRPSLDGENWHGRIEILQSNRGNVRYVECTDNGSGMGRGELLHAFAQGGVRLSHLTEFQEEKLQWRKKNIPFFENSRFGIGVLSYFMLADEIEVVTRKFQRDRVPGKILRVRISGPDNLFHVEESSEAVDFLGDSCGTRIRWLLRDDLDAFSCVTALRSVLGVAKYATTAKYDDDVEVWEPGVYRSRTDSQRTARIDATGSILPDGRGEVFWCEYGGALLIDGISVKGNWNASSDHAAERKKSDLMKIPGAVVNLSGPVIVSGGQAKSVPRLTVDRSQVIDDIVEPIAKRLRAAASSLSTAEFLDSRWLEKATKMEAHFADVIVEGLIEQNACLAYDDGVAKMGRTGYFPGDEVFRAEWQYANPPELVPSNLIDSVPRARKLPSHLALWRYAAHFPEEVRKALGDVCPKDWDAEVLRPAFPSDAIVLGGVVNAASKQAWDAGGTLARVLTSSRALHREPTSVVKQLEQLGVAMPSRLEQALALPSRMLYSLLGIDSANLGYLPHRLNSPIFPGQLLRACEGARVSVSDAISLLSDLTYDVSYCRPLLDESDSSLARALLSERLDGRSPWISDDALRTTRVVSVAEKLNVEIELVVAICRKLGITTVPGRMSQVDRRLRELLGVKCWRTGEATVADVLRVAHATGGTPTATAKRMRAFGVAVNGQVPSALPQCAALLNIRVDSDRTLDCSIPVPLPAISLLAQRTGESMDAIGESLRFMGLDVPFERFPESLEDGDQSLLSRRLEAYRSGDWLNPRRPIPAAHVLLAASRRGKEPQEIVRRLTELGMRVDELPDPLSRLGAHYFEEPLVKDWIPYGESSPKVPLGHVLRVALSRRLPVSRAVEFLESWGLVVLPVSEDLRAVAPMDAALLGDSGYYGSREVTFSQSTSTGAVVFAAHRANISIGDARKRLLELGAVISHPDHSNYADRDIFSVISGSAGDVSAAQVLIAADRCTVGPAEAAARFQAAGLNVQPFDYPRDRPDRDDLTILRENALERGPFLSCAAPVDLEHLLVAAHRLQKSVRDVASRLSILGLKVPDVRESVQHAWGLVPKML